VKKLTVLPESVAHVDLRAKGLLGMMDHDVTLSARLAPCTVEGVGEGALDLAIEASVRAADLEPPRDLSAADREKMQKNLLEREVLDAARWPTLSFAGRFAGTKEKGTLGGHLVVRGEPRAVSFAVTVAAEEGGKLHARGAWEGTLHDLGIKPFKALLGAIRLEDWVRIRLDVVFGA
jgi:YceI-like protein